jgi:biotin carboxyl carrier protein
MKNSHLRLLYVLCTLVLAGCASAAVTQQTQRQPADFDKPTQIVVYPFAADANEVTLNQSIIQKAYRGATSENENAAQLQIAHDTAQDICDRVVSDLSGNGYNAVCVKRGNYVEGGNILIVDGALTNISEGNRLRRLVIGFGTGSSTLDSNVAMYQRVGGNLNQVLAFNTHADSGKMPGAAVMAPVGVAAGGGAAAVVGMNAAVGGAKTYSSSTSGLAKKTSDQIVKTVTDYTARAGWRMQ